MIGAGKICPGCRAHKVFNPNYYKKSEFSHLKLLMGTRDSNEMILPLMHHKGSPTSEFEDSKATVIFKYIPCDNDAECRGCNESEIKTYVESNYTAELIEQMHDLVGSDDLDTE